MKTEILSPLITEQILGSNGRFVRFAQPFRFQSLILYNYGLKYICEAPMGFVCDLESIPWFRGSSPAGGSGHDLVCRIGAVEGITKSIAAEVYRELAHYEYNLNGETLQESIIETMKYSVVRVWPGYFQKHKINATYEEMAGL